MLSSLRIQRFAVARDVTIEPGPGLNVFTGETGAGKSIVVDALDFVLGGRRGREVIATGADRAEVEAVLVLGERTLQVDRAIGRSGRTTARLDGETVKQDALRAAVAGLLDLHGQSEQLGILRPAAQLDALDAFANLGQQRAEHAGLARELRATRARLAALVTDQRERERLLDQLTFEANEIDDAALEPGEDDQLHEDQRRLTSATRRIEAAAEAIAALEEPTVGTAAARITELAEADSEAGYLADAATLLEETADDLRRDLRAYAEEIETDPARLTVIDERLDLIARLRRKYGETVEDVLTYGLEARARIEALNSADESREALEAEVTRLVDDLSARAAKLSEARRRAASGLVGAIAAELDGLGMAGAALGVAFAVEDDDLGLSVAVPDYEVVGPELPVPVAGETAPRSFSESGVDHVEFLASFNPGEDPRSLGAVASGGETSRFLLALTTVLGQASGPRVVVLDEVDEGVGGRAGALVGQALRRLAAHHQVLCVTHLPQVAAFADQHFVVTKETDGAATWSCVEAATGDRRVDELAAMLGGLSDANRAAARDLLEASAPST